MTRNSALVIAAGLLGLTACGEAEQPAENNLVETTVVPTEDLNAGMEENLAVDANLAGNASETGDTTNATENATDTSAATNAASNGY